MSAESFALAAIDLDDVSVGRDDDGFEVTCRSHDGDGRIETESVHQVARDHGLRVVNTIADFEAGEVRLELRAVGGDPDA